jgi:predicted ATP-grasp superfamily ATP-dependent carboligase
MTRIFVYEYTCGGGPRPSDESSRAASLFTEGRAMLAAVLEDFRRISGVEVHTILDARLRDDWRQHDGVRWIGPGEEEPAFRAAARAADWTLVIAPEFDRILESRCRWVLAEGGRLLGPSPDAVALTADKLALARRFEQENVPTPETACASDCAVPSFPPPYVFKSQMGAGSQEMAFRDAPLTVWDMLDLTFGQSPKIVQQYRPGRPASVAFLIGPGPVHALAPASQALSDDGSFRYLGGRLPLLEGLAVRAKHIGSRAVQAVSGLFGYVGVDVVLGRAEDGSEDVVIEINPRLTTSYVGLRALAVENLAEMMLRLAQGESVAKPHWRPGGVRFTADGSVEPQ